MNLPNKITTFRIILVPVFLLAALLPISSAPFIAAVIYVVAMITDKIDGDIARKKNMETDFGRFMDPIADKLLSAGGMLVLLLWGRMYVWSVFVILAREFLVSALRMMASGGGNVIAANLWGKIKTTVQNFGIIFLLLPIEPYKILFTDTDMIINVILVVVTVLSAVDYFKGNSQIFKDMK